MTDEIQLSELHTITQRAREILRERNAEIWRLVSEENKSQTDVAEMFGISRQRVSKIVEVERKRRGLVADAPQVENQSP